MTSATEATGGDASDGAASGSSTAGDTTATSGEPATSGAMTTSSGSTTGGPTTGEDTGATTWATTTLDGTTIEPTSTGGDAPFCGDGHEDSGEECDLGPDNANDDYGGCTLACTLGPRCKDGILQPDEESCDPLDPNLGDPATCNDACEWAGRIVFATSSVHGGDLGGLAEADAICAALAGSAGLETPKLYRAWLSAGKIAASQRVGASVGPFILLSGVVVAESWADLVGGNLSHAIDLDEHGAPLGPPTLAWTGTVTGGVPAGDDCSGWTSGGTAIGAVGRVDALDAAWMASQVLYCKFAAHLYCVGPASG